MPAPGGFHNHRVNTLQVIPYVVSAAMVAVVGAAAYVLTQFAPLPHVSILFVAAVITSAALWGFGPSLFAAVLSVAVASFFFYSPIFDFRVSDAQNIADLAVFVIVAAFTSQLAANVRARALDAQRRQQNIARLLDFSERLAASASEEGTHAVILEQLASVLGRPLQLLLPQAGGVQRAAALGEEAAAAHDICAAAARVLAGQHAALDGWRFTVLATAHSQAGVIAARGPASAHDAEFVRALLGQAALAIERARLRREVADARLKVQGEALREALINSVSHDLHTPLAAIVGSASALESFGEHADARARAELVTTIREESERLGSYIDNVLELTRIRSGRITPRLELVELSDIVDAALRRKGKPLAAYKLDVRIPADLPMLRLDLFLMETALANVLDNAVKYTPPGSALSIAARVENGEVLLDVSDTGSGIEARDLERIFDAFYRAAALGAAPAPGSGLGLAICRAFVEANGGSVTALSAGPGRGATLRLRLPLPETAAQSEGVLSDE